MRVRCARTRSLRPRRRSLRALRVTASCVDSRVPRTSSLSAPRGSRPPRWPLRAGSESCGRETARRSRCTRRSHRGGRDPRRANRDEILGTLLLTHHAATRSARRLRNSRRRLRAQRARKAKPGESRYRDFVHRSPPRLFLRHREQRLPVRRQLLIHGVEQHSGHRVVAHDHGYLDRAPLAE